MKKLNQYKKIILLLAVTLLVGTTAGGYFYFNRTYDTTSFSIEDTKYECSRLVTVKKNFGSVTPQSAEDLKNYCRPYNNFGECGPTSQICAIEYGAVIDILKREDVSNTISKYGSVRSSVKALGHTYINDKEYLNRILPNYSSVAIDCIIVVNSPEGTRFFLENGDVHDSHDDHKYIEVPSEEFLASLNKASDEDVTAFWLGLH